MSHKRNEALRHVQHSMHHVIAAGEGSDRAPDSCKLCPYYRPDFKFRTCLYVSMDYLLLGRDSSRDQFQNELQTAIDHLEKIKGLL